MSRCIVVVGFMVIVLGCMGELCGITVAQYISEFDLPIEHLGDVCILRFDDKNLTSLYGLQNVDEPCVRFAYFNNNHIVGNDLDAQFPLDAFQGLSNILLLNMNHNDIAQVPDSFIADLQQLVTLDLSYNSFVELPGSFLAYHAQLAHVDMSHNIMSFIEDFAFAGLENLEHLDLSDNLLVELPGGCLTSISNIEILDMSNNGFPAWPDDALDSQINLWYANLSNNILTSFSPNTLPKGSEIILTGNMLTTSEQDKLETDFPYVTFVF